MNKSVTLERVEGLMRAFEQGKIPRLVQHEVHPNVPRSSRKRYLYFTLPVALNFQRSSPALWRAALKTWEDPKTQFVFFPELAVRASIQKLQSALTRHSLAVQPNRHTKIWHDLSNTLHEDYKDNPRNVLKAQGNDCQKVIELL